MFSTELSPEIWLSMNFCRVATFAFGNSFRVRSRVAAFAGLWPPFINTNE